MVQSQRAELIIMERRDVSKYLKRSVRAEMDAILGFWDYESVLEQSVRFKIETCDRRLSRLAAERAARASLFTDLILLGIGVTSILATAVALTEFGRVMGNDPEMNVYDLGRSSLVQWVASQPADTILIGAASTYLYELCTQDEPTVDPIRTFGVVRAVGSAAGTGFVGDRGLAL